MIAKERLYIVSLIIFQYKIKLLRLLRERNYSKDTIRNLFNFLDAMVKLNDTIKEGLFKEEWESMPIIVDGVEIMGDLEKAITEQATKKGLEQGIEQGKQQGQLQVFFELIETALEIKFGESGLKLLDKVKDIKDINKLRTIKELIKKENFVETLEQEISRI